MKDVIDRIREIRRKISEGFGHDTIKLVRHYQELEKKTKHRVFERDMKKENAA